MKKRDVIGLYRLPTEVRFCKKCTVSNQRPRITFDEHGVCSACNYAEYKRKQVDWDARERDLIELCDQHHRAVLALFGAHQNTFFRSSRPC